MKKSLKKRKVKFLEKGKENLFVNRTVKSFEKRKIFFEKRKLKFLEKGKENLFVTKTVKFFEKRKIFFEIRIENFFENRKMKLFAKRSKKDETHLDAWRHYWYCSSKIIRLFLHFCSCFVYLYSTLPLSNELLFSFLSITFFLSIYRLNWDSLKVKHKLSTSLGWKIRKYI